MLLSKFQNILSYFKILYLIFRPNCNSAGVTTEVVPCGVLLESNNNSTSAWSNGFFSVWNRFHFDFKKSTEFAAAPFDADGAVATAQT